MRFIFKTDYDQDIRIVKHGGQAFWYGLLGLFLLAAPWVLSEYMLAQLVFVLIYATVGLGLMLLAGFTGQFSIGHAAFLGVGAYTQAVLTNARLAFSAGAGQLRPPCRPSSASSSACRRCASRASTWASPRWLSASSSKKAWRAGNR